jgi:hypothetical protein
MWHVAWLGEVAGSSTLIVGARRAVPRMAAVKAGHYYVIKSLNSKRKNQKSSNVLAAPILSHAIISNSGNSSDELLFPTEKASFKVRDHVALLGTTAVSPTVAVTTTLSPANLRWRAPHRRASR